MIKENLNIKSPHNDPFKRKQRSSVNCLKAKSRAAVMRQMVREQFLERLCEKE